MKFINIVFTIVLLMVSNLASASLIVGVSDIQLTGGSNSFLTWSTDEFDNFSFELDGSSSQQYGTFSTQDFPIRACEGFLCLGTDIDLDAISASFLLTPPGSTASSEGLVYALGQFNIVDDQLFINFDNSWIDMGSFEVSFRDSAMTNDGTVSLFADFREVQNSDNALSDISLAEVPEPSIITLLASGILGVRLVRRRQSKNASMS